VSERPLWAPWRIEYVTGPRPDECIFCTAASSDRGKESLVVDRGRSCFTMLNAYPYAPGHLMVSPYRHVGELEALDEHELAELMRLVRRAVIALGAVMSPGGFNVGLNLGTVAGAGIAEHLHMHVVPRWQGDTNFMPVLADVHVLPQALEATRNALLAALRSTRS
jgi:ATP adenylyltransferase